jgi:methylmalonyl-CoA mutase N-terminal domain/subunit
VRETLALLKKAARGTDNVVPPILEAVKAYASLGEISDVLREVFGEYRQS